MSEHDMALDAPFKPTSTGTLKMSDLVAHEYLLRIGDQRCDCGEVYRHHELLLVYVHPQWTGSTKFRKLVPVERRERPDLKVGTSFLQPKRIPLCIACMADVRQPEPRPMCSDRDWAESLARETREARASSRPATPAKPKIDIDKLDY